MEASDVYTQVIPKLGWSGLTLFDVIILKRKLLASSETDSNYDLLSFQEGKTTFL